MDGTGTRHTKPLLWLDSNKGDKVSKLCLDYTQRDLYRPSVVLNLLAPILAQLVV